MLANKIKNDLIKFRSTVYSSSLIIILIGIIQSLWKERLNSISVSIVYIFYRVKKVTEKRRRKEESNRPRPVTTEK